jgi:hypothetical protein
MGPLEINLSQAFAGQKVGVKQVEEKIGLVRLYALSIVPSNDCYRARSRPMNFPRAAMAEREADKPSSNVSAKLSTGHRTRSSISAWPPRNARLRRSQSDTRPIC